MRVRTVRRTQNVSTGGLFGIGRSVGRQLVTSPPFASSLARTRTHVSEPTDGRRWIEVRAYYDRHGGDGISPSLPPSYLLFTRSTCYHNGLDGAGGRRAASVRRSLRCLRRKAGPSVRPPAPCTSVHVRPVGCWGKMRARPTAPGRPEDRPTDRRPAGRPRLGHARARPPSPSNASHSPCFPLYVGELAGKEGRKEEREGECFSRPALWRALLAATATYTVHTPPRLSLACSPSQSDYPSGALSSTLLSGPPPTDPLSVRPRRARRWRPAARATMDQ